VVLYEEIARDHGAYTPAEIESGSPLNLPLLAIKLPGTVHIIFSKLTYTSNSGVVGKILSSW
jgi:hypothetical protein